MKTKIHGKQKVLEVGTNIWGEVIVNHFDLELDDKGHGHIIFSPTQARAFAHSLLRKADEAEEVETEEEDSVDIKSALAELMKECPVKDRDEGGHRIGIYVHTIEADGIIKCHAFDYSDLRDVKNPSKAQEKLIDRSKS